MSTIPPMASSGPETQEIPGVAYALTAGGVELPVIDVTHPAFAVTTPAEEQQAQWRRFLEVERRRRWMPFFLRRFLLRSVRRRSVLMRGLMQASGSFLSGLNTYLLKLGPGNLSSGWASEVDRRIAGSYPALDLRLRLQATAQLLADGLAGPLAGRPGDPLHLLNIAGGPAADSLNALILLRRDRPALLAGRKVHLHILDLEAEAPRFGERALQAVTSAGHRLAGLDATFTYVRYNWAEAALLRAYAADHLQGIVAVSSEGGLFEYGADEDIVANLAAVRGVTPADTFVVGSVTRPDEHGRPLHRWARVPVRPRSLAAFGALAARAGWKIERVVERSFSNVVQLARSA